MFTDRQQKKPGVLALFMLLFLVACSKDNFPPQETAPDRNTQNLQRSARYDAEAEETLAQLDTWKPWYDALRAIDHGRQNFELPAFEGKPGGDMVLSVTQRVLYESGLRRIPGQAEPSNIEGFRKPLEMLIDLANQLRKHGIDFLLMPVPPQTAIYPEMIMNPLPGPPPLLDWRMRQWYAALERGGVEVVDLLPELVKRRFRELPVKDPLVGDLPETVYLRHDSHWSPYGSAIGAELLSERIRRYPWFDAAIRENGQAVLEEYNELMRGIGGGRFYAYRTRIKGERERSVSDRESPILIIGDSFCFPKYGLTDQLLKQLGFRIDLVYAPGGAGLFDTVQRLERLPEKRLVILVFYPAITFFNWKPITLPQLQDDPAGTD